MRKNIYEVFDEFAKVDSKQDKINVPDTKPGISYASLDTELKRLYMFRVGNETAEKLSPKRAEEILMVLLESLEPREADVVIGIFKKDLGVKGLTLKFIRENIPDVL